MDWLMDAGGREKMRVQIWVEKGAIFQQSWISGLAVAHCSACFHTKHSALAPNQFQSIHWTHQLTLSFPPWRFGSPLSSPSSSPSPIQYLLPLAVSSWVFLPSLFLSSPLSGLFSSLPVAQRGVGSGQGLKVSIVILCVLMSLVLTMCSKAKLSWQRGCLLFTKNFDHSLQDVCVWMTSQLFLNREGVTRNE